MGGGLRAEGWGDGKVSEEEGFRRGARGVRGFTSTLTQRGLSFPVGKGVEALSA